MGTRRYNAKFTIKYYYLKLVLSKICKNLTIYMQEQIVLRLQVTQLHNYSI